MAGRRTRPFQRYPARMHLDDLAGSAVAVARLVGHRLVQGRVEGPADRVDALEALALQDVGSRAPAQTCFDVLAAAVGEGQVGGVEHGQQLVDQALGGPLEVVGLLLIMRFL